MRSASGWVRRVVRIDQHQPTGSTRNGRGHDERPGENHLPAAHLAREPRAFRVAERAMSGYSQHQQIARLHAAAARLQRERDRDGAARDRREPEAFDGRSCESHAA